MLPAALLAAAEHDVRGLLNTLKLGADTLVRHLEGAPLSVAAATMARATDRLSDTLSDLVVTAGELLDGEFEDEAVDFGALAREVADQFGVDDLRAPSAGRLLVGGSEVVFRHLVSNLVDNAVTAGGASKVQIRVRTAPEDRVRVVVRNPTRLEAVPVATSGELLRTRAGRGLRIVRVLAAAADVEHSHQVVDGVYVSRLSVPGRIRHPSLEPTRNGSPHHEAVIAMDAFRTAATTSQSNGE